MEMLSRFFDILNVVGISFGVVMVLLTVVIIIIEHFSGKSH